jgi:zinc/manganese transport system permease protein
VNTLFAAGFFSSQPVQTALLVGGIVAFVTGIIGVFTVTRGQSFAGHALADLGAVGGSAAFLLGINQVAGFVGAGIIAAILMEAVGIKKLQGRDVATGIIFGFGLGLTALFLYWDTTIAGSSNAAISVLFGSLFVLNTALVPLILILALVALAIVVIVYRWLLMDALGSDLAAVQGVPVRVTGIAFLIALALAVELSSLSIGAILSTALLIGPAAAALRLTKRFGVAVLLSGVLGLACTWVGILVSYDSYNWFGAHHNWPVSFCIVALVFLLYLASGPLGTLLEKARTQSVSPAGMPAVRPKKVF